MLALEPGTVDLGTLPPKGQDLVGVGGKMAPQDASAEFGQETLEASAEVVVKYNVPEPATLGLLMVGGAALLRRRK